MRLVVVMREAVRTMKTTSKEAKRKHDTWLYIFRIWLYIWFGVWRLYGL